jgi:predicted AlkP superfamily phosphohydrolase/phosphomutase
MQRRVVLIGWDAADWKVARPLLERGEMPHLARLVARGASGNLATLDPPLSPMLWTSIATGKRPTKHGIHGFTEPLPDGSGVRPITTLGRKAKALWNILNQEGLCPSVVGWWPSHPAEPVHGIMVSNHFHHCGTDEVPRPLVPAAVHPPEWRERLAELRIVPMDLPGELIQLFVPEYRKVDQSQDKRLHTLGKILAETMTVHAAATEVLEHAAWDFAGLYYDAIDHFSHAFMAYHPPRLPWIKEEDFAIYQHVVVNAYRYHDAMLGRLLDLAGQDATVIVMSDHGFHPDQHRPGYIPAEAAGPAVEHRHFGILVLAGPGIKPGETIYGASILDIAPTVLHLFGLPVGADMDGKVLVTALERPGTVAAIPSWDDRPGDAGTHPPGAQLDPVAAAEAMKQLVALGYVAPPGDDVRETVAETTAELRYNLARAHDDAGRPDLALPLYEALRAGDPDDARYVDKLVHALIATNDRRNARAALEAFDARMAETAPKAEAELARRRAERPDADLKGIADLRDQREQFERRVLSERAGGFALLRAVLRLELDLADERFDEAREALGALEDMAGEAHPGVARFLGQAYTQLRDDAQAEVWLVRALEHDPDDWHVLALLARLHLRARRFARALDAASASLALLYFQPVMHYVMGRSLLGLGDVEGAERSLRTAALQSPGLVPAHEALARLYERRLNRPADADRHRLIASDLRKRARRPNAVERVAEVSATLPFPERTGPPADPVRDVVVVAGLPRSGTSMLMQILHAGGVAPLTDGLRAADTDNLRGYFEFEPATRLAGDASWLPQARGRAVKLVLPLVVHLPRGEVYRIVLIERDVHEVIASQHAMLERLGRQAEGAALDDTALADAYRRQRERVRSWLEMRPEVAVLALRYETVLADPRGTAERIGTFLGHPNWNAVAAAAAIAPELRHQISPA